MRGMPKLDRLLCWRRRWLCRLSWQLLAIQAKRRQGRVTAAVVRAQERQQVADLLIGERCEGRHAIDLVWPMAGGRLRLRPSRKGRTTLLDPLDPVLYRDWLGIWQHLAIRRRAIGAE